MKNVQYSLMFCLFHCFSVNAREAVQPVVFYFVVVVLVVVIVTIVFRYVPKFASDGLVKPGVVCAAAGVFASHRKSSAACIQRICDAGQWVVHVSRGHLLRKLVSLHTIMTVPYFVGRYSCFLLWR